MMMKWLSPRQSLFFSTQEGEPTEAALKIMNYFIRIKTIQSLTEVPHYWFKKQIVVYSAPNHHMNHFYFVLFSV